MGRRTVGSVVVAVLAVALVGTAGPAPAGASAAAAPQRERIQIGTSVGGRPIMAVHRWRAGATRTVLVVGNMHGDERAGLRVVNDLRTRRLPESVDLWLIPTLNPDGTEADRRTNDRGVDLNRNFPRRWLLAGGGTPTYSGPRRASEPETRALMDFVREHQPRTTVVVHQPLHGVDSYRAKSMRLVRRLASYSGLPIKSFSCNGGCHGTFTEWHNDRTPGRAVTLELGRSPSAWRIGRVARAILLVGS